MATALSRKFHGKKFMWDGMNYENGEQAEGALKTYKADGFEVEMLAEGDQYLVYTRRMPPVQTGN